MTRYDAFLLRIWRSAGPHGSQWSARLEHLQDREVLRFTDLQALVAHLLGKLAEDCAEDDHRPPPLARMEQPLEDTPAVPRESRRPLAAPPNAAGDVTGALTQPEERKQNSITGHRRPRWRGYVHASARRKEPPARTNPHADHDP